ncbi:MAG: MATE family efflux transporter [Cypionkella sp.]|uniref:MATE family efflux transporter n=1 Tax=Cypionkella sp. TaxID=2811411 RepID=UPI002ABB4956|nr:MATE family efflux transporter [Cypionkella sp.]MDZ4311224.1 MATE family efflux transporter [Cypionkella sp.]
MRPLDLGSPDLTRTLLRGGLPAMGGLALNAAHQSVDGAFLGHLGTEALAAVSLALPLAGVTAALGVGLGVGTATAIARRLGAGQLAEAGRIASAAMALCLCLSVVAMLALMLGRGVLLDLLGASDAIRAPAEAYLLLMAISAGLGIIQILCDFIAIGEGNARFSLISLALCFGLNIMLDPLFIFGFGWGIGGAAAATILSQVITLGLYTWYFATRRGQVLLRPHFDWRGLGPVLRVGAPETATVLAATGSALLLYRLAAGISGVEGLAALGIVLRLVTLASLPIDGFCLGAQAVLAHAAGAGDTARLVQAARKLAVLSCGAAALAAGFVFAIPDLALMLFAASPTTAALAKPALLMIATVLPLIALRSVAQVTLQATERAGTAALLGLAPSCWLLLPLLALFTPAYGFQGLALSLCLAAALAGMAAGFILWRLPHSHPTGVPA